MVQDSILPPLIPDGNKPAAVSCPAFTLIPPLPAPRPVPFAPITPGPPPAPPLPPELPDAPPPPQATKSLPFS